MPKTTTYYPSRRTFMKAAAATVAVPMILPRSVFGANEKLNIAWVGFGNMGWGDLNNCAHGNNVVALADVNKGVWERSKNTFKEAELFQDFREMLDKTGDKIDAVGVGTPDHTHFAVAYTAMSMGKHVFVEKPLVHSLWEARTLQKLAKEKGLVTQMGNQGHGFEGARLVKEWYEAGLIGDVKEVITWTDRPAGGWGFSGQTKTSYPAYTPVPEGMDWDLWLGPTTKKIGFSQEFHPTTWRPWWDFGCGGLGDIGCHTIDTPYWALDLGVPDRVEVEMNEEPNPIHTPKGSIVTYRFPARGKKPPVALKWYEGPSRPTAPEGYDGAMPGEGGMIMVGEQGGIWHPGMRPDSPCLYPAAKWQEYKANTDKRVPKTLERVKGVHDDWVTKIKSGKKTISDFSYSGPLTEVILLGTLAIRTGKTVDFDARRLKIKGNAEAQEMVNPEAREGFRVKDLA